MSAGTSQSDEPSLDRRSADVAIVCTQRSEVAALLDCVDRQRSYTDDGAVFRGGFIDETIRVAIVEAGTGFAKHRQATETLIAEHSPKWLLSVGFSSPLLDELQHGDVCLADEICDTHGNSMPVKCPVGPSDRITVARHVVADVHPATAAARRELSESTRATAVDTCSLAVAQLCRPVDDTSSQLPQFVSIRGVVKPADDDLSDAAVEHLFAPRAGTNRTLLGKLGSRFRKDPELVALDEIAKDATRNLNRFVLSVIRKLATR